MKYYCFRDISHNDNLHMGKTYHAAGVVDKVFNECETPSCKDLSVTFLDPFDEIVIHAWRTYKEVELFEIVECEHIQMIEMFEKIENCLTN